MSRPHRWPAGAKLFGLVVVGAGVVALPTWWLPIMALAAVVGLVCVSGSARAVGSQVRPLWWVVVPVAGFHVAVSGWRSAVEVVGSLLTVVVAAALVTATTTTTALVDVVVRLLVPLRRLGVDPERVGLLLALSVRSVAVVTAMAYEIRDAQRARGLTGSPRAFGVPLLVRSLRHADRLGEALVARGIDD